MIFGLPLVFGCFLFSHLLALFFPELFVLAVWNTKKALMTTLFDDLPIFEDYDQITVADCAQTMCNHKCRGVLGNVINCILDFSFSNGI